MAVIKIPENATNGDVINDLFNVKEVDMETIDFYVFVTLEDGSSIRFWKAWWNAPYKENKNGSNNN